MGTSGENGTGVGGLPDDGRTIRIDGGIGIGGSARGCVVNANQDVAAVDVGDILEDELSTEEGEGSSGGGIVGEMVSIVIRTAGSDS